jgi:hypothetical protein
MKKNLNSADRIIRLIVVLVFAVLYFGQYVTGTAGIVLLVLGIVFALTAVINFCPIYYIFGLSTRSKSK